MGRSLKTPEVAGALAVLLGVVLVSPFQVTDLETFMRLAFGRVTLSRGPWLGEDPFLYSLPGLRWRNPQWLGDVLLYGTYRAAGETGLVGLKLLVHAVGWLLTYRLGLRRGGSPFLVASLILLMLAGSEWRMTERNDMFVYVLVPLYGLVLDRARTRGAVLWLLPLLGVLWANLHASFVIGWLLVGASLIGSLLGPERDPGRARLLALVLLVQPILPLLSPDGRHAYGQVVDHLRYAAVMKGALIEWQPAEAQETRLRTLPVHLLGLVGLGSFLFPACRRQVEGALLVVAGLLLAHSSNRFVLLFAALAVPTVAANLSRARAELPGWWARAAPVFGGTLAAAALALLVPAVAQARTFPSARQGWEQPSRPARWMAAHAPAGSRLFAPFNGSQALLWEAPQVPLYIAPHFTFSARFLAHFLTQVLPHPERFESEARRLDISLALVDFQGLGRPLLAHLAGARHWRLVYLDGHFALFARQMPRNESLIADSAYHCLRATLAFSYLPRCPGELRRVELERLGREAPALARAIEGFELLLEEDGAGPGAGVRDRVVTARGHLESAVADLPSSPALLGYLVEAHLRLGDEDQARSLLDRALGLFPRSQRLWSLAGNLRAGTALRAVPEGHTR